MPARISTRVSNALHQAKATITFVSLAVIFYADIDKLSTVCSSQIYQASYIISYFSNFERKVDNVETTVKSCGKLFQSQLPDEGKARSPAVTSLV